MEVTMTCENKDHERFRGVFQARNGCLACQCEELAEELAIANKKWIQYEQEYILPCFGWAQEEGIDLRQLVKDNPGKNCVRLLIEELRSKLEEERNNWRE